ncbi:MAG: thiamine phosphate synthase [Bacillota bacterium]
MSAGLRGLYAIADTELIPGPALPPAVEAAIRGGARLVQYRDKSGDAARRASEARALLEICRGHGVPCIVNDDVELAAAVGADGVHLGKDDVDPKAARVRLGPRALVGVSCYDSLERAVATVRAGADYVAFGSFFPSDTKPGAVRPSLELLTEARRRLSIPLCAIGGITPENGGTLVNAGADMLAVIRGLFAAPDIAAVARAYARLF